MRQMRREFLATLSGAAMAATINSGSSFGQDKKYRACIIGDWKEGQYGHAMHRAFSRLPQVEVVGLADPHEKARAKFGKESGAARTYADYREMLSAEKPDLVSIGPRFSIRHKEYLLAAAEIGAHGYMEKPVAVDLAEADEMVQAVESKNLKWAVAHQKRMTPLIAHTRKMVFEEGLIGEILELRARGKEDRRAGGEDLLVLGTHIMDLLLYFLGRPQWVMADITVDGRPARKEDVHDASEPLGLVLGDRIQAVYGYDKGLKAFFSTMKTEDGDGGRWGLDIYGTKGIATIRIANEPIVFWLKDSSWAPGGRDAKWEPLPDAPPALPTDNEELIDAMNSFATSDLLSAIEENREPGVSLQKGRDALDMILGVYDSYFKGTVNKFPSAERTHPLKRL